MIRLSLRAWRLRAGSALAILVGLTLIWMPVYSPELQRASKGGNFQISSNRSVSSEELQGGGPPIQWQAFTAPQLNLQEENGSSANLGTFGWAMKDNGAWISADLLTRGVRSKVGGKDLMGSGSGGGFIDGSGGGVIKIEKALSANELKNSLETYARWIAFLMTAHVAGGNHFDVILANRPLAAELKKRAGQKLLKIVMDLEFDYRDESCPIADGPHDGSATWRGKVPVICLALGAIAKKGVTWSSFTPVLGALIVHEVAHLLGFPESAANRIEDEARYAGLEKGPYGIYETFDSIGDAATKLKEARDSFSQSTSAGEDCFALGQIAVQSKVFEERIAGDGYTNAYRLALNTDALAAIRVSVLKSRGECHRISPTAKQELVRRIDQTINDTSKLMRLFWSR